MNRSRLYVPVVLVLLASGGLVFGAAQQTWARSAVSTPGLPDDTVTVSGSDALAIVPALGLVVVAAALAIIAASVRLRRVVGALVVIVAIAGIVITVGGGSAVDHSFVSAVHDSPAFSGQSVPEAQTSVLWPAFAITGFVVAAVAGAMVMWWAGSWTTMGSRYDAPAAHAQPTEVDSDAEIWHAQDDGHDPTE